MDRHPTDRGPSGTHHGAVISNANLYRPAAPRALRALGPLARQASEEETCAHDEKTKELSRDKLGRIAGDDEDGTHRVMCPAALGRCRCALRPGSAALDDTHPEVLQLPEHPPTCYTQKTISVPAEIDAKCRQRHEHPSKAHRFSDNRRTASERGFSWFSDPATAGTRRGWSRSFGRAPNALMDALCAVVRNVRLALAQEDREAEAARRAAMGLSPLERRRPGAVPGAPSPRRANRRAARPTPHLDSSGPARAPSASPNDASFAEGSRPVPAASVPTIDTQPPPPRKALFTRAPSAFCELEVATSVKIISAPPASHNANLESLVEGPAISLATLHTKVRREGYRR